MFHMWVMPKGMSWWWIFSGVWLLLCVITKLSHRNSSTSKRDLLNVAKERYAKGEISKEEFEQIKKDLS